MPSFSMLALMRSGWPSCATPGSVTRRARLTPRRLSSQPASSTAPGPNLIGVASSVKTVSWCAMRPACPIGHLARLGPMPESFCTAGDVELCYETFGSPDDPALLLVMGLAMQMLGWHEDLCEELAGRGFFVIRYDNRDVGRSTWIHGRPPTMWQLVRRDKRAAAYQLSDMAADGVGLLDHLGISRAHVVGASMGGMIAQTMAIEHPDRVLSLVSIMSNTGARLTGQPALAVYPALLKAAPGEREAFADHIAKMFDKIGSPGFE